MSALTSTGPNELSSTIIPSREVCSYRQMPGGLPCPSKSFQSDFLDLCAITAEDEQGPIDLDDMQRLTLLSKEYYHPRHSFLNETNLGIW